MQVGFLALPGDKEKKIRNDLGYAVATAAATVVAVLSSIVSLSHSHGSSSLPAAASRRRCSETTKQHLPAFRILSRVSELVVWALAVRFPSSLTGKRDCTIPCVRPLVSWVFLIVHRSADGSLSNCCIHLKKYRKQSFLTSQYLHMFNTRCETVRYYHAVRICIVPALVPTGFELDDSFWAAFLCRKSDWLMEIFFA